MAMVSKGVLMNSRVFVVLFFLLLLGTAARGLRPYHFAHHSEGTKKDGQTNMKAKEEIGMELYPTGSSLPDCSHACGACMPCRRVMVSFSTCSVESCPVIYRCMCNGKYYHVPSN